MTYVDIKISDLVSQGEMPAKLIKVKGQLDESNVDENAKKIYDLIEKNPDGLSFVFDFSGLEYMNSKSIGYLTDWYGKLNAKKGKIVIAAAKENIVDILQVVGLTQLIPCVATLDEAKLQV